MIYLNKVLQSHPFEVTWMTAGEKEKFVDF